MNPNLLSRRRFLGQASCAAVSGISVLNTLLNLRLAGTLSAVTAPAGGEYRALVCIFQAGGNDSFNMLTPFSGPSSTASNSFTEYTNTRSTLALSQSDLIEIHPTNTPGRTFGVHNGMPQLASLFESGKAAFMANVGTLVEPVQNVDQVNAASKQLPLGLYSHSDQMQQWQTSIPNSRSGVGWAGRLMDELKAVNSIPAISMNISTSGSNVWQTGITGAEYSVDPGNDTDPEGGAVALVPYQPSYVGNDLTDATSAAIDNQIAQQYTNLLEKTFQQKRQSAQDAYAIYAAATAPTLPGNITFPNTAIGRQLHQVAKAIMGRTQMGAIRQTFFVQYGGWDHHSDTINLQAAMLPQIDAALYAFWQQLGALGVQPNVTVYSASDFGRTLTSNGNGSDHAWGSNVFVVGGSVLGKKIYGSYPSLAVNPTSGGEINPLDTGRGRMIPTTSCDQFFAEMALWLGVPASSLSLILPNLGNFYDTTGNTAPVGFLA